MTELPSPPPPGPPPPPGSPAPQGHPYFPPPPPRWVLPKDAYTPWSHRAWAFAIDWAPLWVVLGVPFAGFYIGDLHCNRYNASGCEAAGIWAVIVLPALLLSAAYFFWNFCHRQGKTGQSIGKSVLKFRCVSSKTWQPIGFGLSFVRQLAHHLDQTICYVGYLFPLWDDQRQTFADKIMSTVCVSIDQPPPPPTPPVVGNYWGVYPPPALPPAIPGPA